MGDKGVTTVRRRSIVIFVIIIVACFLVRQGRLGAVPKVDVM